MIDPDRIFKKLCNQCQVYLPSNLFHKNKNNLDGLQGKCLDCLRDYKLAKKLNKLRKFEQQSRDFYCIPNIYIVGFGRTQTFQNSCLSCDDPFFCLKEIREEDDLFCDRCLKKKGAIPELNKSKINYVGNVTGWLAKTESPAKKRSTRNYKNVYQRDKYTCRYCNFSLANAKKFQPLHIDHIKPWSAHGGNSMNNLVVSCQECNLLASDKWFVNFEDKRQYILWEKKKRANTYGANSIF